MRIKPDFNSAFLQPHQAIRCNCPIMFAKPAVIAAMLIQHFHVQFRAVKINRIIHDRRCFAIGKRPFGTWRCAAANDFASSARQQKPMLLCAANQAANLAGEFSVARFAPAIFVFALQRKKFPGQPELLINFRKPPRFRRVRFQRRMSGNEIHAAKKAADITMENYVGHGKVSVNRRGKSLAPCINRHACKVFSVTR